MGFWLHMAFSLMKVPKEMIQRNNGTEEKLFIYFFSESYVCSFVLLLLCLRFFLPLRIPNITPDIELDERERLGHVTVRE